MKRFFCFAGAGAVLILVLGVAAFSAGGARSSTPGSAAEKGRLEHGRYLVERVGLCGDCHTPHNEQGEPVAAQSLQGASVAFKPLVSIPNWAEYTPPLAGFPGFTDEQAITFLTTGKNPGGKLANPPMPAFRFSHEDAAAILAYLRSLGKK